MFFSAVFLFSLQKISTKRKAAEGPSKFLVFPGPRFGASGVSRA